MQTITAQNASKALFEAFRMTKSDFLSFLGVSEDKIGFTGPVMKKIVFLEATLTVAIADGKADAGVRGFLFFPGYQNFEPVNAPIWKLAADSIRRGGMGVEESREWLAAYGSKQPKVGWMDNNGIHAVIKIGEGYHLVRGNTVSKTPLPYTPQNWVADQTCPCLLLSCHKAQNPWLKELCESL